MNIRDYDFYRSNNIFIWGIDKIESLRDWLNSPYEDIPSEIINKYDSNNWITSLLKS